MKLYRLTHSDLAHQYLVQSASNWRVAVLWIGLGLISISSNMVFSVGFGLLLYGGIIVLSSISKRLPPDGRMYTYSFLKISLFIASLLAVLASVIVPPFYISADILGNQPYSAVSTLGFGSNGSRTIGLARVVVFLLTTTFILQVTLNEIFFDIDIFALKFRRMRDFIAGEATSAFFLLSMSVVLFLTFYLSYTTKYSTSRGAALMNPDQNIAWALVWYVFLSIITVFARAPRVAATAEIARNKIAMDGGK